MPLTILPTAGQSLNVTRDPIRNNFTIINTDFPVDHAPWNDATNPGKHLKVTMPIRPAAAITAAGEIALYSATSALTGNPELIFRRQNNGTIIECTSALIANPGWTYLPSGIILAWGQSATNGAGAATVAYARPFPTNLLNIETSIFDLGVPANALIQVTASNAINFTVRGTVNGALGALGFTYLAIGY